MQIANVLEILNRIEVLITQSGMAKQEFYDKSGISSGSFSQWRTGTHTPSLKKLQCAANALNVSLDYILYGEEAKPVEPDEKGIKKDPPMREVELTDAQKEAWALIQKWDDEKLRKFIAAAKAMLGE